MEETDLYNSSHKNYLPLIQPLTANAPIRRLDVYIEYSTLGLIKPLKFTEDNPL
jgi:hypothetical protein